MLQHYGYKAQPKIEESRITQQSETIIIPAQSTIGLFILLLSVIGFLIGLFHEFPISAEAPVSPVFGIDFIKRISINFTFYELRNSELNSMKS